MLQRKQTYRRILLQETEDDESENDVPAETQNEDPDELQNVTDKDDDHGQNKNSDIYGCENILNDDHQLKPPKWIIARFIWYGHCTRNR